MAATNQRTAWIDVLKCITILFVVLGHHPYLTKLPTKVFNVIFSFHIPLFFFISGYLFNPNIAGGNLCRKRFTALIRPYLFTIIVVSLVYVLVKGDISFLWYIFWAFYGNGPNLPKATLHLWFLPHLFIVIMFVWALFRYIKGLSSSLGLQLTLIIILLASGVSAIHLFWDLKIPIYLTNFLIPDGNVFLINGVLDNPAYSREALLQDGRVVLNGLPWSLDIVLISAAFFMSGYLLKKTGIEQIFNGGELAIIIFLLFAILHYFYNFTMDLNLRRYDNLLICTLLAYAAIYVCVYASYAIANSNIKIVNVMTYIGRYSLIIFILHPFIQSRAYFTMVAYLPDRAYFVAILPAIAAGVCVPLLLNWLVLERFKFFRYWYYTKTI